ncbi:MAG TPA: glycosyltransferase [Candidatus Limnocylindrales bacterium]|nr:glycosyltransferase [Candidatus Limnocylindrales bacterium]
MNDETSSARPLFSVIIGVYNDWGPLDGCLASLAEQAQGTGQPPFEVIVVDDGSEVSTPENIGSWNHSYALTLIRQAHSGVASARNRGVQTSKGSVFVFADADCRFQRNALVALASTLANSPQHDCFQLRLAGDCSTPVGRIEHLRLTTLQDHLRQADGSIRYLNTAGFAIRRTRVTREGFVFDPAALRAEDTLVLANLIEAGELPFFVDDSIIEHAVSLSVADFFLKGVWSAYQEGRTYDVIAAKGVRIRVSHRERLSMLVSMWRASADPTIGRLAWFTLAARQSLRLVTSFAYRLLRGVAQLLYLDRWLIKTTSPRRA